MVLVLQHTRISTMPHSIPFGDVACTSVRASQIGMAESLVFLLGIRVDFWWGPVLIITVGSKGLSDGTKTKTEIGHDKARVALIRNLRDLPPFDNPHSAHPKFTDQLEREAHTRQIMSVRVGCGNRGGG